MKLKNPLWTNDILVFNIKPYYPFKKVQTLKLF